MKIPSRVNVAGHTYKVEFIHRDKFKSADGRSGECEWPSRVIRIARDLKTNKEYAWAVFLHELKHAHQFECGMSQVLHGQTMEVDCEQFSSLIISLQKQKIL